MAGTRPILIFFKDDMAFIDMENGFMLGIGSKENVEKENGVQLAERIAKAMSIAKFNALGSKGETKH